MTFKDAKSKYKSAIRSAKKNFRKKNYSQARKDTKEAISICKKCDNDLYKIKDTLGSTTFSNILSITKRILLLVPTLTLYNMHDMYVRDTFFKKYIAPNKGRGDCLQDINKVRTKAAYYLMATIEELEKFLKKIDEAEEADKINGGKK